MRKMIFAAIAISIPAFAFADAATDAVKARQDNMKARGAQVGMLAKMAKGEVAYDAAKAQEAADMLIDALKVDASGFWIPGTTSEDMPGVSYAKPELWSNFDKAKAIGGEMMAAAMNLQAVAGNGQGEMAQALGGVGQGCQGCHKEFQVKKD